MKILHVESGRHLYGGVRQVLYILEGLQARNVENVLVCAEGSEIARQAGPYAEVRPVKLGGDLDFGFVIRLYRLIKQEQPDVVHLHSRRGADTMGGLAARLAGVPCVLSRRVDNPEPRWLLGLKYGLYDKVITISEGILNVLREQGVDEDKLVCVRSAVDLRPYLQTCDVELFRQTFALSAEGPVVGMVAQLIRRKGHRYLLEAATDVLRAHPDTQIVLFGKGALEQEIRQQISARGLEGRVHVVGFRHDLERWLGCLDLLVHPADMEGLGVSLIQAAAARVPIIASRVGGIPEIVHDGENGLLIEPGDAPGLARAMIELLADLERRHAMGEQGRELVRQAFSVDVMVEGNLSVYRQLLSA